MKASVVIPSKNPGALFRQVMQQVLQQTTPWPYDVLVIDSGSTDGTVEYLQTLPDVRLQQIPPQAFGHGKTRNLGCAMTEGEFIIMLTQDALPTTQFWLQNLVAAVEQSDDIAGAFGRHIAYPEHGPLLERDLRGHFAGFRHQPLVRNDDPVRYREDAGYRQFLHFFSDNNACLRRRVWQQIPYPEVEFAEDQLWAQKIIEAGYAKAYADEAVVYHSHAFSILEEGSRGFDEAYALHNMFGYALCPNLPHLVGQTAKMTLRDWQYLRQHHQLASHYGLALRAPLANGFKLLGQYWGQRAQSLPNWLTRKVSRDRRLRGKG